MKDGSKRLVLDVWLLRTGEYACGRASELYDFPGGKAPYGFIAGRQRQDAFHVQYSDSFTGSALYDATLRIVDGRLRIETAGQPSAGWLVLDVGDLSPVDATSDSVTKWAGRYTADAAYQLCMRSPQNPAEYLREGTR